MTDVDVFGTSIPSDYGSENGNIKKGHFTSEKIERVLDGFDFEKTHLVMTTLNWRWWKKGDEYEIPSCGEIRRVAKELLIFASNRDENNRSSSGGLEAEKRGKSFSLTFKAVEFIKE